MLTIKTRGRELNIPGHIDELSPEQYERFLILSLALTNGDIDLAAFRQLWLSFLIGMTDYSILLPEYVAELDAALPKLDGFFDGNAPETNTVRNLLPEYHGFRGPSDCLNGFPFGKFIECLTVLSEISGDVSESEYVDGLTHVARVVYEIPPEKEVPALLLIHAPRLIANVWSLIHSGPLVINGASIDFRILFHGSGSGPDDHTGWTGVTYEIAEKGLFGTVKEVEATDLWAVLIYLYKCKFEYNHEIKKMNQT